MISWKIADIAQAVGGELVHAPEEELLITSIGTDSRDMGTDSIFVPLVAERNGHDFVASAVESGAVASFWSDDVDKAPDDLPVIVVDNTEKALKAFAKWHLQNVAPTVVGVTGSNGKTTTKDMTDAILSTKYKTHKTPGNENNQLGVPRTLLSMPSSTEVLILEMGMSEPGEISILSEIGEPDIAIITMIGESHIQAFDGSRKKLAQEKLDILTGLKEGGLFIRPQDEDLITDQFDHSLRNQTFGEKGQADIFATDIEGTAVETTFTVGTMEDETITITIPVPGKYNVQNALMAILVGMELEVSLADAKKGLETMELTKDRLEWIDGKNDVDLLNDAYNASPTSMKAAVEYFAGIEIEGEKIAVLGDILELGDSSKEFHESIADAIELDQFKAVYLYGDEMKALYEKLADAEKVTHFTGGKEDLIKALETNAAPGDSVLFKSSNGTDLLSVVDKLRKEEK